ncbi:DUF2459 domain-containing protein [Roseococcus pinisoli]|uniref:DUF2459 domain-containing protein n=1 Tax=Roseococcus pinisoli TaxID=2835040 RepID=A0ABS5QBB5_9PROT|nr:DUF2459 domain-containing protein [Roseococcus pinisoli]MBS7810975.1 DUF2459 domain-containing protein [Roseococcus pinisoli]
MSLPRRAFLAGAAGLSACATLPEPAACTAATGHPAIWVVERSWHTEIGIPAAAMGSFATVFPGAAALMFGFGKRNFMISPARGFAEWLAGPFPGPAVMQVTALNVLPPEAFDAPMIALPATSAALEGLVAALWRSFAPGPQGEPVFLNLVQGSAFYEAARGYSLAYTCNAWTAEMLTAAGFPVHAEPAMLPGAVMRQLLPLAGTCRPRGPVNPARSAAA